MGFGGIESFIETNQSIVFEGKMPKCQAPSLGFPKYFVTRDQSLIYTIEYLKKNHTTEIRREILSRWKDKYPLWIKRRGLPNPRKP